MRLWRALGYARTLACTIPVALLVLVAGAAASIPVTAPVWRSRFLTFLAVASRTARSCRTRCRRRRGAVCLNSGRLARAQLGHAPRPLQSNPARGHCHIGTAFADVDGDVDGSASGVGSNARVRCLNLQPHPAARAPWNGRYRATTLLSQMSDRIPTTWPRPQIRDLHLGSAAKHDHAAPGKFYRRRPVRPGPNARSGRQPHPGLRLIPDIDARVLHLNTAPDRLKRRGACDPRRDHELRDEPPYHDEDQRRQTDRCYSPEPTARWARPQTRPPLRTRSLLTCQRSEHRPPARRRAARVRLGDRHALEAGSQLQERPKLRRVIGVASQALVQACAAFTDRHQAGVKSALKPPAHLSSTNSSAPYEA